MVEDNSKFTFVPRIHNRKTHGARKRAYLKCLHAKFEVQGDDLILSFPCCRGSSWHSHSRDSIRGSV